MELDRAMPGFARYARQQVAGYVRIGSEWHVFHGGQFHTPGLPTRLDAVLDLARRERDVVRRGMA